MSQNVYDRPDFFEAYSKFIDRSGADIDADPAWNRLHTLVPDVSGSTILDLGCGSGWFCRWAADHGARHVLGLDLSEKMLAKAASLTNKEKYPQIEYRREDLDALILPGQDAEKYDLAFSSLTLHYLQNLEDLMVLLNRVLKPGSLLVLNVEHPIYTAPYNPRILEDSGEKYWSFNSYYKEGERSITWLAPDVRKQHRTLTSYMNIFLGSGFDVAGFIEWLPKDEELAARTVAEVDEIRPLFLMMSVRKRESSKR